ncbi:ABC transporter ATP-binding protein [Agromyces bracchium]|uniref:ATP-binding cassette domain-containing protein n=1 Tax=Agromyces bracchium TaxID=88376 RepID=A0A6I3M711_9MICO|nr:ABC transporter ATP-binding protein [Agromyces bracchium]MTH69279.1 ATP-binding cassette domain-containing protein [Agromyces bracchium]
MSLVVDGVTKTFGGNTALQDVSFTVETGKLTALIGPNGAGKTTMFNCIAGLHRPTSGTVTLDGRDITGLGPSRVLDAGIARTFQLVRSFRELTVLETIMTAGHWRSGQGFWNSILALPGARSSEETLASEAHATLEALGLHHLAGRRVHELPYGQQRLVEIAKALMTGARTLLLDEPAAGLHPEEVHSLRQLLAALRDRGTTILLVEHNMPFVLSIADHVVVLEFGRKITDGTPVEIANDQRVIDSYLGKEEDIA